MPTPGLPDGAAPTRRRALAVGGAAVGAAAAACAAPAPAPPDPAPPGGPPAVTAAGSAGTPLGPVADVPVGGGVLYPALEVVVTRPAPDVLLGFSAVCTHTGCLVTAVSDGAIRCPCHGSRYHLDGTVAAGPAPRALPSRPVTVADGQVVLT